MRKILYHIKKLVIIYCLPTPAFLVILPVCCNISLGAVGSKSEDKGTHPLHRLMWCSLRCEWVTTTLARVSSAWRPPIFERSHSYTGTGNFTELYLSPLAGHLQHVCGQCWCGVPAFQRCPCSEFVFLLPWSSQREWCAHDGGIRKGERVRLTLKIYAQPTRS